MEWLRLVDATLGHVPPPAGVGAGLASGEPGPSLRPCSPGDRPHHRVPFPHGLSGVAGSRAMGFCRSVAVATAPHARRDCGRWCAGHGLLGAGPTDLADGVVGQPRVLPGHLLLRLVRGATGARLARHRPAVRQRSVPNRDPARGSRRCGLHLAGAPRRPGARGPRGLGTQPPAVLRSAHPRCPAEHPAREQRFAVAPLHHRRAAVRSRARRHRGNVAGPPAARGFHARASAPSRGVGRGCHRGCRRGASFSCVESGCGLQREWCTADVRAGAGRSDRWRRPRRVDRYGRGRR